MCSLLEAAPRAVGETYALVSLHSYLAPDRLTPILGGVSVSEVYARVADRREAEAAENVQLADKLTADHPAERTLRDGYLSDAATAAAEATAFRSECTCVYAAVVRPSRPRSTRSRPDRSTPTAG